MWSVRRSVLIALGMGLLGLATGFVVYYGKGKPTPNAEPELERPAAAATAPLQLAGLGFLPADTNIAFAVQTGPLLTYAAKHDLDPRELLTQAGIPARAIDTLNGSGISLPQIDHIAGGTSLGDGTFSLRLTLVLVLRKPLADEDAFLHKLEARKQAGKARYDVVAAGFPLLVARVSPTVWVFGLDEKDFEAVNRGGHGPGGKQFPGGLAQSIGQQVPPDADAWLAANDERGADKAGVKVVLELLGKKEWLPVLAKGRAGMAALSLGDKPRLRIFVKAADESIAQQLRSYFQKKAAENDTARTGGAGEIAFYDAPVVPAKLLSTLKQFLADAVK
jgi:hypothetical protein